MTLSIAAASPAVLAGIADRDLRTAARHDLEPLLLEMVTTTMPPARSGGQAQPGTRAVARVLDWLEAEPGEDWPQRWDHWTAKGEQDWRPNPSSSGKGVRIHSQYAMDALIVVQAVTPAYPWLLAKRRKRLWRDWMAYHDNKTFLQVADAADKAGGYRLQQRTISALAMMCMVGRKTLDQLTAEDFEVALAAHHQRGTFWHGLATTWVIAKQAGLLAGERPSLLEHSAPPPKTPAQLVDRHGVQDPRIRQVFIDYLTERAVSLDYATVYNLEEELVANFWCDIQAHHPSISSLHLSSEQAAAWRARAAFLRDGRPRKDFAGLLERVRTFYNDISAWAMDDPARWAPWAAPNPVPRRLLRNAAERKTKRQGAQLKQRTRSLAPCIPQLVAYAKENLARAERDLAAAAAAQPGQVFDVDGQQWKRASSTRTEAGAYRPVTVRALDPAGSMVNLTQVEQEAFWTWAAIEVLRHSGVRIEEALELSHLSIRPFRKTTGEIVPLLQVAPSKTNEERIIPISPELAHALSRILQRLTTRYGEVPVIPRFDPLEHTFGPPLPHLFQYRPFSTGRSQVLSGATIRGYLIRAARRARLTDTDGTPLHVTPHDFRRLFLTDVVKNKLPVHIAAQIAGHRSLNSTNGYVAIYPQDVFDAYEAMLDRQRALRPGEEYRTPTPDELRTFAEHFGRRRVELGDCVRPYGTSCVHEHACLRCQFLTVHPGARARLDSIEADLSQRIETATQQAWLGDVEQLRITMTRLREKRDQLPDSRDIGLSDFDEMLAAHPIVEIPSDLPVAQSVGGDRP